MAVFTDPKWNPHADITEYTAEGDEYIPMLQWGKDHWSTFAYLETTAVDGNGVINNTKFRCHPRLHRIFANLGGFGNSIVDGSKYPTILHDGSEVQRHDDWSCLEDMVNAGLLRSWYFEKRRASVGSGVARVEFTSLGWQIAAQLREFKGNGGNFATFVPNIPDAGIILVPAREAAID